MCVCVYVCVCVCRDVRWNKGTILRASVEYIKRMQKDVQRSREVENNFKRMEMANKQLWLRIQVRGRVGALSRHRDTCIQVRVRG